MRLLNDFSASLKILVKHSYMLLKRVIFLVNPENVFLSPGELFLTSGKSPPPSGELSP